ncbi:MAG: DUF11 domain-containing protein, partial [Gammaproteobacteria bacterium]|nr:DUF11 domain-containing protein [Gammaproteobacteria bacterium]
MNTNPQIICIQDVCAKVNKIINSTVNKWNHMSIFLPMLMISLLLASTSVQAVLDLAVEINPPDPIPGEQVHVRVTVTNPGAAVASNVGVQLLYPSGLDSIFSGNITDSAICSSSFCSPGEIVVWNLGNLAPGEGRTLAFSPFVRTNTTQDQVITFTASALQSGSTQATSSPSIQVNATRIFDLTVNPEQDPAVSGNDLSYDLTFGHRGSIATTGTELRFPIPADTTFASADGGATVNAGEVIWSIGLLNPGEGGRRRVTVQLDAGLAAGDIIDV